MNKEKLLEKIEKANMLINSASANGEEPLTLSAIAWLSEVLEALIELPTVEDIDEWQSLLDQSDY